MAIRIAMFSNAGFFAPVTAVFIKVAISTLHLDHVTRSKIAFRSCD